MIYYVIPSRRNSIGVSFKNRMLLSYTLNVIPENEKIIFSTDDEVIIEKVKGMGTIIERSEELSGPNVCIKKVMVDVIEKCFLKSTDVIVMLYLVYQMRTREYVLKYISFYNGNKGKSLLCCYETLVHPFLSFYAQDNFKGKPIVKHNFYRRQDYPECFSLSHFICIFNVGEINNLKEDLYNDDTLFYPIEKPIDIDTQKDIEDFTRRCNERQI